MTLEEKLKKVKRNNDPKLETIEFELDNDILENHANLVYGSHSTLMHLDDDFYNISIQAGMNYFIFVSSNEKNRCNGRS